MFTRLRLRCFVPTAAITTKRIPPQLPLNFL